MYTDPYQRFGRFNDEMLRAMRLVVDTGIHAKGWTRDQSIKYMLDNSGDEPDRRDRRGRALHRHPGQALAYKVGQLTIRRLRDQAEGGTRAEVRRARVPRPGARYRRAADAVLETKIDAWIAAKK